MSPFGRATSPWRDEAIEEVLGRLLQAGVVLAAILVLAGGIPYLVHHGGSAPPGRIFTGEPDELKEIGGILRGARQFGGRALIMCGLLVLIATPVMRVAASLVAFVQQRDRIYAAMTAFVLALLLASMLGWLR
jgi:uncharacterized membrane protein